MLYFDLYLNIYVVGFDRVGHDGLARMVITIRNALDEYHCEVHSMVVEHNKAFCRLRFIGPLLGIAPTFRNVAWMGATEFTIQNHKILKVWELGDVKSLEEQLLSASPSSNSAASNGLSNGNDSVVTTTTSPVDGMNHTTSTPTPNIKDMNPNHITSSSSTTKATTTTLNNNNHDNDSTEMTEVE
jgi:predicted ester cyclase